MIPKTLYTYFGGNLSWLRYMTIVSFKKFNPDWDIKVYYPKELTLNVTWGTGEQGDEYDGHNWFEDLKEHAELIEFDAETIGFSNDLPEVHKSGLFRHWVLSTKGGVYCDMDILFFKPLVIPEGKKAIVCYSGDYFSDGFIGCEAGHPLMVKAFNHIKEQNTKEYQGFGPNIWNRYMPRTFSEDVWNIPMSLLYNYNSQNIHAMFSDKPALFPVDSIGMHWYGGSPVTRRWEQIMLPDNYEHNIMISRVLREVV